MNSDERVEIIPIALFQRQAKRLVKKFPSLKQELLELLEQLRKDPIKRSSLGNGCYKIRLPIASKGKGKSGGARVITCLYMADSELYLLSIHDKSELSTLTDKEIEELVGIALADKS